ncbi:unnamed protein product [Ilex paraguariensis]|uniref:KIB1-4 beta-propeller domain-containing protein n=1 Tax=Ilex paraguariensis TaxID=185542 RepID=A0ABC8SKJ2_9AQUA
MPIHDSPPFGSPCLMFLNKKNRLFNFFDPTRNATYQADIPELVDANIRCSKEGWLLMCQGDETVFFFNPFSKEKIKLPDIPICYAFTTMCFSTPPTSLDCQVFGIESIGYDTVSIGTFKVGDGSWTINLYVVYGDGRQVDVLKLDLKKAAWHEVQSLGDKMMYVCHFGSFPEKAVVRGSSNKERFLQHQRDEATALGLPHADKEIVVQMIIW